MLFKIIPSVTGFKKLENSLSSQKPLRILHVISTLDVGGAENHLITLMGEQANNGLSVSVVLLQGNFELRSKLRTLQISYYDLRNYNLLTQIFKLRRLIDKFDLIHAHLPRAELISRIALLNRNLSFVISRHNAEAFWPNGNSKLSKLLSIFVTSKVACVIAISQSVKNFLLISKEVNPSTKIEVVYYALEAQFENAMLNNQEIPPLFEPSYYNILCVGRLVPQKDHQTLFIAFSLLLPHLSFLKLHLVGDGFLKTELQNLAEELGIAHHIVWHGRQFDVIPYLKHCDLFILSSRYEGFGLVLLEAMAANVPLLAAANPTVIEILGIHHPGLFTIGDSKALARKIHEITTSMRLKRKYLESQSSIKIKFSREIMVNRTMECYNYRSS